jgi:hypothetical protein
MQVIREQSEEKAMAINMAARRAAKAIRRKAIVAQKRKAEALAAMPTERARIAAATPIQHCLVHESLFESGLGTLVLARGLTPDRLTMGVFLVDVFCLGIKDAMIKTVDGEQFADSVDALGAAVPLVPVDPTYARKLLREVATWAAANGFPAYRDFAAVERLVGDVDANACDATFQFGRDGKPFYVPGPFEPSGELHRRLDQLAKRFADDVSEIAAQDRAAQD